MSIVDFLYNGEANVFQESLDSFLALAEDLMLKGLTGSPQANTSQDMKPPQSFDPQLGEEQKEFYQKEPKPGKHVMSRQTLEHEETSVMRVATINNQSVNVELHQLDDQIKSMMEHTGNSIRVGKRMQKTLICKVCGKEGQLGDIMKHIESNHITGVTHTCDICSKTARSRDALYQHKRKAHHA